MSTSIFQASALFDDGGLQKAMRAVTPDTEYSMPPEPPVGMTYHHVHVMTRGQGETPTEAAATWKQDAIKGFAQGTGEWIVWRLLPKMEHFEDFATGRQIYQIVSRAILPARAE